MKDAGSPFFPLFFLSCLAFLFPFFCVFVGSRNKKEEGDGSFPFARSHGWYHERTIPLPWSVNPAFCALYSFFCCWFCCSKFSKAHKDWPFVFPECRPVAFAFFDSFACLPRKPSLFPFLLPYPDETVRLSVFFPFPQGSTARGEGNIPIAFSPPLAPYTPGVRLFSHQGGWVQFEEAEGSVFPSLRSRRIPVKTVPFFLFYVCPPSSRLWTTIALPFSQDRFSLC